MRLVAFPSIAALAVALATASPEGPAAAQAPAPAPEPAPAPPAEKPWYEAITVNGIVSASYSYGFNGPASGKNQLRVFDFDDNTIKLDVASVAVQRSVAKPGDAGFRVDVAAGGSHPRVTAASGLFRDPQTGEAEDFDLQQAFVSWIAPVGSGLRIDAGKFFTTIGYEYVDRYDGYNDSFSRSFLFGYAEPFTHTGLKASYAFSETLSGNVLLVNGWDNVKDNNSSKTVGAGLTLAPSPKVSVTANYMVGPERTDENGDARSLLDLVALVKPSDTVTLGLNADFGSEAGAAASGGSASWWGVAGYLRLGLTPAFALCVRGEYFDDQDGARTGVAQQLTEVTLTPEVRLGAHLVFRADLRVDSSDQRVFEDGDGALSKKQQTTVAFNALYTF